MPILPAWPLCWRDTPDLRVWFLVDSMAQLTLIEDWASRSAGTTAFDVLLEMGIPGQRTGCRTLEQALDLARAIGCVPRGSAWRG